MESFISAILGELTTRSINFFISKLPKPTPLDVEDRLRRVLLRAQVIIDEAKGRHITNHAMLLQLVMLRDAMHLSHYVLDTFTYQLHHEEDANNQGVSRSLSLSKVNSAKSHSSRGANTFKDDLQGALDNLSSMILDVNELVLFLSSYPRLNRQPYNMHIVLGNCMFGRQMEVETVINFLLQTQPYSAEEPEVLPIVGPKYVRKSTLVAHVCKDERVLDHFGEIIFLHDHGFIDDELTTFRERRARKYQNLASSNKVGRLLVVVELVGDLNEGSWDKLHSTFKQCIPSGSKIIVTSRSDKIVKFGTKQALTLKHLSHESFWYFFKTLTFGSMDPEAHPRFVCLAMEIAKMLDCYFIGAYITASLLRDNFDIQFWCKITAFLKGFLQKHGEHPFDLPNQNRPAHLGRMATPSENFVIYHQYQCSGQEEVPKITFQDVMYGTFSTSGKFEFLTWRSSIPPYFSYVATCEILELKVAGVKRKRSMKDGGTLR